MSAVTRARWTDPPTSRRPDRAPSKGSYDRRIVPVVDIAPWASGGPADRLRIANEFGAACEELGFLQLVGHGLSPDRDRRAAQRVRCVLRAPDGTQARAAGSDSRRQPRVLGEGQREPRLQPRCRPSTRPVRGVQHRDGRQHLARRPSPPPHGGRAVPRRAASARRPHRVDHRARPRPRRPASSHLAPIAPST